MIPNSSEGWLGLFCEMFPNPDAAISPKDGEAAPHEAEWDGKPVLTMKDDGRVGLTAPFDGFSRLELRRECVDGYRCGHGWQILALGGEAGREDCALRSAQAFGREEVNSCVRLNGPTEVVP
jgi:hypothetical protein